MSALAPVLLALAVSMPAMAAAQPGSPASTTAAATTPPPAASTLPARPPRAPRQAADPQHATMGDVSGGQFIPQPVLAILADPRIDPDVAYMLWQLSRRPLDSWKLSELAFVGQIAPTEVEAGLSITKMQTLYQFWGLDPNDVFNPSLGANWQSKSTAYSPDSATSVGAISSADCQVDASQMTLGTYRSCIGANQ
jgi:hypothetical protein